MNRRRRVFLRTGRIPPSGRRLRPAPFVPPSRLLRRRAMVSASRCTPFEGFALRTTWQDKVGFSADRYQPRWRTEGTGARKEGRGRRGGQRLLRMKTQLGGVERLGIHAPISARAGCRFRDRSQILEIGCRHPHPIEREPAAAGSLGGWPQAFAKLAKYSAAAGSLGPVPTSIHLTKKPGWQIVVVDSISFHGNAIQGKHGLGKTVGNSFQD